MSNADRVLVDDEYAEGILKQSFTSAVLTHEMRIKRKEDLGILPNEGDKM